MRNGAVTLVVSGMCPQKGFVVGPIKRLVREREPFNIGKSLVTDRCS